MGRIYLSPPHLSGRELELIRDAVESNWVAPLGPHVDAFEEEFAEAVGVPYAAALSSGTAALHLALRILTGHAGRGTNRGRQVANRQLSFADSNEVLCSTFTFAATANAIVYEVLVPVFIDCDAGSWNMDPGLLREELEACAARGKLPRAVIVVDLYGQCADYDPIVQACAEFEVPLIEDAAEALGAVYWGEAEAEAKAKAKEEARAKVKARVEEKEAGSAPVSTSTFTSTCSRSAGSFGAAAAFSFNGNKILTTAGGGMLVSHDRAIIKKARFLATQARDRAPHYQHSEIGFNYRMSNILAAIGRGQLEVLPQHIAARRHNFEFYQQALGGLPGIEFMPEAGFGRSTRWLTCLMIDPEEFGATSKDVRLALERRNIEARPVWKPMHLQPVFKDSRVRGGGVSKRLFAKGLCLPSGSALTEEDLARICAVVRKVHEAAVRPCVAYQVMGGKRPSRAAVSKPNLPKAASTTSGK
jgi:pyridoxal phosphate-dependent aminotransferase EpsN